MRNTGKRKTLQELTLKDNFMFGAVMSMEENCKGFLEMTLGFPIQRIEVSKEKSMIYHPEYKGVRLDIYADDENHTHYNVEMQVSRKKELGRRSRYYHSQVDMELLGSGAGYTELSDTYVIFICIFDPFGKGKYCYTFQNCCKEEPFVLKDGSQTIFLSTEGKNEQEVPESLVKFLRFVKADLAESEENYGDGYVRQLQNSIQVVKKSREMGERYMIFEEMMRDERAEGILQAKQEAILELLEDIADVPEELQEQIGSLKNHEKLSVLLKKAAKAESLDDFIRETREFFESEEV